MENPIGPIPESDDPPQSNEEASSSALRQSPSDVRGLNIDSNKSPGLILKDSTHPILENKERSPLEKVLSFGSKGKENEPKENKPKRAATGDTHNSLPFDQTRVWDQKSILSLDGGGIRGYSSLLILRALMRAVGEIERTWPSGPAQSSFHPLEPSNVDSSGPPRHPGLNTGHTERNGSSLWLPCHYFDYMAGTSTGGLISIMLGRLRMSIDDCIADYESLGLKVFAHSRWFHLQSLLFWPRDKYDHRTLENAIKEVINRRAPYVAGGDKNFASDESRCRTIVLSYRKQEQTGVETPYIFRSYDNLHRNEDPNKRVLDRNPGVADKNEIWKVARATSAAPTYFKPMKIDDDEYLDGGFGANNPCAEIWDEVRRMNNSAENCVGIIVSVGTGKNLQSRFQGTGLRRYIGFASFTAKWATESEMAHTYMERLNLPSYVRFNVEKSLGSIKLDEWQYRGSLRIKLGEAISKVRPRRRDHSPQTTTKNGNPLDDGPSSSSPSPNLASSSSSSSSSPPTTTSSSQTKRIPKFFCPKNKTLEKITKLTEEYLSQPDIQALIQSYARGLVETRRARASQDEDRWEKSCYRIWYHCKIHGCPRGEEKYSTRDVLRNHILNKHVGHTDSAKEEIERTLDRGRFLIL